jgi:two-component system response regulator YesN
MYKVLIVDDELLVRIGLKSMVEWESVGFEIIGEAGNGEAAYEKYLALRPDVLITDIKMPKKDGFWLIEKVREENKEIPVVVLTCYDEFSYVREALKLQVFDYILKAEMEDEQVTGIMEKIFTHLEKQHLEIDKGSGNEMQSDNEDEQVIGFLIDERKSVQDVKQKLKSISWKVENKKYCLLQLDFNSSLSDDNYNKEQIASILSASKEIIINRMEKVGVQSIIKQFGKSLTCFIMGEHITSKKIMEEVGELKKSILQYFDIAFTSASTKVFSSLEEMKVESKWILSVADLMFYIDETVHVRQEDIVAKISAKTGRRERCVEVLIRATEEMNETQIQAQLEEMRQYFILRKHSSMDWKLELVHIIDDILKKCEVYLETEEINSENATIQKKILDANHINETLEQMQQFLVELGHLMQSKNVDNSQIVIAKAKDYIEQNYSEKLALEDVASAVGISKFYFSNLFKKVCGVNFSVYLNQVRIEKAKLLLKDTSANAGDVAYMVGFSDPQYFSKTFKKVTGKTVGEWKAGK